MALALQHQSFRGGYKTGYKIGYKSISEVRAVKRGDLPADGVKINAVKYKKCTACGKRFQVKGTRKRCESCIAFGRHKKKPIRKEKVF